MPYYLIQAAYTSESWAAQIKNPQDRAAQIRALIESKGGKLHHFFYAFGEYDVVAVTEAPDNAAIAEVMIAIGGGGAASATKTTVLMTAEEGLAAVRGAGSVEYRAPGG